MEHRWGERVGVDLPVRITGNPYSVRAGRLANLSISGGFILTDVGCRVLSRIQVVIEASSHLRCDAFSIPGYIARKLSDGIGIEWCEFAPFEISRILQARTSRRSRLRKVENPAAIVIARLYAPQLKHGS
jgi:hypothetical protein